MQNNVRGNVQGKYASKDASKVNMYEIAQLSRAAVHWPSHALRWREQEKEKGRVEKKQEQREK